MRVLRLAVPVVGLSFKSVACCTDTIVRAVELPGNHRAMRNTFDKIAVQSHIDAGVDPSAAEGDNGLAIQALTILAHPCRGAAYTIFNAYAGEFVDLAREQFEAGNGSDGSGNLVLASPGVGAIKRGEIQIDLRHARRALQVQGKDRLFGSWTR